MNSFNVNLNGDAISADAEAEREALPKVFETATLLLRSLDDIVEFENMPPEIIKIQTIKGGASILFESSVLCRILNDGLVKIVQFPARFADKIKDRTGIIFSDSGKTELSTLITDDSSSIDSCCSALRVALEVCLDSYQKEFDCCNTLFIKDGGCCDAKRCINPHKNTAMGCGYKKNLRHGIYFIGKNKNA